MFYIYIYFFCVLWLCVLSDASTLSSWRILYIGEAIVECTHFGVLIFRIWCAHIAHFSHICGIVQRRNWAFARSFNLKLGCILLLVCIDVVLVNSLLRHEESFELFVSCAFARINQISYLLFLLVIILAAVECHKLVDCQEATAHANHNGFTFNFHENFLSGEAINARRLSLEMHLAPQTQRCLVDIVGQISVDTVFLDRFVDE